MNATKPQTYEAAKYGSRRWLILILVVTALGRIAFLVLFPNTLSLQASGYDTYATSLIKGHGYTRFTDRNADSDLPPLYPFFLSAIYILFGHGPIAVASVQIGFDLLTTLLLYLIGKRIVDEKVGLLAALFYGLYPYLLFQNLTINDTGIFIFLLVSGIWLAYRACDTRQWSYAAALGGVFGLGALTKTFVIGILPLLGIWWRLQIDLRTGIRLSLVSMAVLLAIITPWIVRNSILQKELVFISTNDGSNLYQGNNSCIVNYLSHGWDAQWVNCLEKPPEGLSEIEIDDWFRQQAIDYLRDHPAEWPRLFGTKLLVLWSPSISPSSLPPDVPLGDNTVLIYQMPPFKTARVVHLLYFGVLLMLGIVGLIWAWHDKLTIGPLVTVFIVITLVYVIFHPSTRYRSPADPFLFILSAYTVARLHSQIRMRWQWG